MWRIGSPPPPSSTVPTPKGYASVKVNGAAETERMWRDLQPIQNSNFPNNGKGHMPQDPWDDHNRHLQHLPDQVLFSVARNDCADRGYRRHAVEILVTRKSHYAKNPELADLVAELEIELDGIEFEHPVQRGPGPLVASVTTDTLQANDVVPAQAEPVDTKPETKFREALQVATAEFHTDQVPATLPDHSGSVLVVTPPIPVSGTAVSPEPFISATAESTPPDEKEPDA